MPSISTTIIDRSSVPPPVPPGTSMRALGQFRLWTSRLRKSRAWRDARKDPRLGFYFLNLWLEAWDESIPAGSLPDDDDDLAEAARCDPDVWPDVVDRVTRGLIRHSDGRLYHPVVVEAVLEVLGARRCHNLKMAKARAGKARKRLTNSQTTIDGNASIIGLSKVYEPLVGVVKKEDAVSSGLSTIPLHESSLSPEAAARARRPLTRRAASTPTPPEPPPTQPEPDPIQDTLEAIERAIEGKWPRNRRRRHRHDYALVASWIAQGITPKAILERAGSVIAREGVKVPPTTLAYLHAAMVDTPTPPRPAPAAAVVPFAGQTPWEARVRVFRQSGLWLPDLWGPSPSEGRCRAPQAILERHGYPPVGPPAPKSTPKPPQKEQR